MQYMCRKVVYDDVYCNFKINLESIIISIDFLSNFSITLSVYYFSFTLFLFSNVNNKECEEEKNIYI